MIRRRRRVDGKSNFAFQVILLEYVICSGVAHAAAAPAIRNAVRQTCWSSLDSQALHCWRLNEKECSKKHDDCSWMDCADVGKCIDIIERSGCSEINEKHECKSRDDSCTWWQPPSCANGWHLEKSNGVASNDSDVLRTCTGLVDQQDSKCWMLCEDACYAQYDTCIWTDCKGQAKCVGFQADISGHVPSGCDDLKNKLGCHVFGHYCTWLEPPLCVEDGVSPSEKCMTTTPPEPSPAPSPPPLLTPSLGIAPVKKMQLPSNWGSKEALLIAIFVFICRGLEFLLEAMTLQVARRRQGPSLYSEEEHQTNLQSYEELLNLSMRTKEGFTRVRVVTPGHMNGHNQGSSRTMQLQAMDVYQRIQPEVSLWKELDRSEADQVKQNFGEFIIRRWGYTTRSVILWGVMRLLMVHIAQLGITAYVAFSVKCSTLPGRVAKIYSCVYIFTYGVVVIVVFFTHLVRWHRGKDQLALLNFSYYFVLPLTALLSQNIASQRPVECYWQIIWDAAFFFRFKPERHLAAMALLQVFLPDRMWVIGSLVVLRAVRCCHPEQYSQACCGLLKTLASLPLWVVAFDCLLAPLLFVGLFLSENNHPDSFWIHYALIVSAGGMLSLGSLFLIGWRSEAVLRWSLGFVDQGSQISQQTELQ